MSITKSRTDDADNLHSNSINKSSIDARKRMMIPAVCRDHLRAICDLRFVVTWSPKERCLWLYPEVTWHSALKRIADQSRLSTGARAVHRMLVGNAHECECDYSGRVLLRSKHIEYAYLNRNIYLVWADNKFEIWDETLFWAASLQNLTTETAKNLAVWHGGELYLNGLRAITVEAVVFLSQWRGNFLHLGGLKTLTVEIAMHLTQWRGKELCLNGLDSLTVESAACIAKWQGESLWLNGLKGFSADLATTLANWDGEYLSLSSLQSMTVDVATIIARFRCNRICLNGLEYLTVEAANSLVHYKNGEYYLSEANTGVLNNNIGIIFNKKIKKILNNLPVIQNRNARKRLHCSDGPALILPDGFSIYAINGVHVPRYVVTNPETITVDKIEAEPNIEIRRVMIERYGLDRYIIDIKASIESSDTYGALYRKTVDDDEPIVVVKVRNATAEPDGSFKYYFLRVPPLIKTAREAVAWTFGINAQDYDPSVEA